MFIHRVMSGGPKAAETSQAAQETGQHTEKCRKHQISANGMTDSTCVSLLCFRESPVGVVPTLGQGVFRGALNFVMEPQTIFHHTMKRPADKLECLEVRGIKMFHGGCFTGRCEAWTRVLAAVDTPGTRATLLWYIILRYLERPEERNILQKYADKNKQTNKNSGKIGVYGVCRGLWVKWVKGIKKYRLLAVKEISPGMYCTAW